MTKKEFMNAVANGKKDVLQILIDAVNGIGAEYCVVGGLAVNAHTEPVVSLDLDLVVSASHLRAVCDAVAGHFTIKRFPHRVHLISADSDLRIRLQTDARYQAFLATAAMANVLGNRLKVASRKNVLRGKLWAYGDRQRRTSKRQKDLADILRLVEAHPELAAGLPAAIHRKMKQAHLRRT